MSKDTIISRLKAEIQARNPGPKEHIKCAENGCNTGAMRNRLYCYKHRIMCACRGCANVVNNWGDYCSTQCEYNDQ